MSTDEELAKTVAEYALIPTVERAQVLSIEGSTVHVSSEFTLRQYAGETCRKQRYEAIHWVDLASGKSCCVTVNRLVDAQRLKSVSPERRYVLRGFEEGVLEVRWIVGPLLMLCHAMSQDLLDHGKPRSARGDVERPWGILRRGR